MGDNGKLEPEPVKTPEQLASERLKRYQENPDSFVEITDIIACVIRNPGVGLGVATYIDPRCKRQEFDTAYSELQVSLMDFALQFRMRVDLANKKIIPAKGGFLQGIRNMGRK